MRAMGYEGGRREYAGRCRGWGLGTGGPGGAAPSAARVAAFTSPGLRTLGIRVGFPLAVITVTVDPSECLRRLRREEHGCWTLSEDWAFDGLGGEETDPLPPLFEQVAFDPRWLGGRRLPGGMAVDAGSLLVALPGAAARDRFAAELKSRLIPRRLDVWGARPGGVLRRRATGRAVAIAPRYSRVPRAGHGSTAFRLVDDLYRFRPRDLPALAAAAIASHDRAAAMAAIGRLTRRGT